MFLREVIFMGMINHFCLGVYPPSVEGFTWESVFAFVERDYFQMWFSKTHRPINVHLYCFKS